MGLFSFFFEPLPDDFATEQSLQVVGIVAFERLLREFPMLRRQSELTPKAKVEDIISLVPAEKQREVRQRANEIFGSKKLLKAQEKIARILTDILVA